MTVKLLIKMVVGNGMLAREFSAFKENEDLLIFASGVSNSQENNPSAFERELKLLLSYKNHNKKLIYFSTISIYDPELTTTEYIKHKLRIEKIITNEFPKFIIFRLPQLVGKTDNPHTLCNFLYNKIIAGETITVFENACRYLMDVSDVGKILSQMIISDKFENTIIDVNFNNKITINDLLYIFEDVLTLKINRNFVKKGGCYDTENDQFISQISQKGSVFSESYNFNVINKYYGSQLNH